MLSTLRGKVVCHSFGAKPGVALRAACLAATLVGCSTGGSSFAPQRIALNALPNGIAVRPSDGALFLTDDTTNSVLFAADDRTFEHYAVLPTVPGQNRISLSQLLFADSKLLLVARFGFGVSGALVGLDARGPISQGNARRTAALDGPDPVRRRLGLALLAPGQVLSTWFVKQGNAPQYGGLSIVTYDAATDRAAERDLMTGLVKPVGVVFANGYIYVTDQATNRILKARADTLLAAPQPASSAKVVASIDRPDLLAASHDGTLYTKCGTHGFCKIASDGTVTQLANDFHNARGVAIDETRKLLYVIDRAEGSKGTQHLTGSADRQNDGIASEVRVLPLR
jgi:DNA-binding beta-propeller fold protein YncE